MGIDSNLVTLWADTNSQKESYEKERNASETR